jgi:hypothetical protein
MPWKIFQTDGKSCVHKLTSEGGMGELIKCFDTQGEAEAQLKALYANAAPEEKALLTDWWDVDSRQLPQASVAYLPLGFAPGKGCATCHWFVSPNSCVPVMGDISPTGICDLWREIGPEQFFAEKSWFTRLVTKVKSLVSSGGPSAEAPVQSKLPSTFHFIKSGDQYRFFTTVSNCFKDRHDEIIATFAHKEYVDWATATGNYPELWLWHCGKKSRWGMVDWIDYDDNGFVVMSGLVDAGKEQLAHSLQGQVLGTSHGFLGQKTSDGTIVAYRSYEVSPLPSWAAANVWTGFNLEEVDMAFSKEKRAWLKDVAGISEDMIGEWEASLAGLSKSLTDMGLEWKGVDTPNLSGEIVALTGAVTDISTLLQGVKAAQDELRASQQALQVAVAEQTKTFDERVTAVFTAKIAALPQGFQATKENATAEPAAATEDVSWFGDMLGGLGVPSAPTS